MYLTARRSGSSGPAAIIVRDSTEARLRTTCFRGKTKNLASNFSIWESATEIFDDWSIRDDLLDSVEVALDHNARTNSITLDLAANIGWAGTDDVGKYSIDALEPYAPNRKSTAMRVKLDRRDLLAPTTSQLTIIYELKDEGDQMAVIIHSIYPGKDIGVLCGNITVREQCVFFDWNHPGA